MSRNPPKHYAAATAEIILCVERRCRQTPSLVGTVGQLDVPHGPVNVVPGACRESLDTRAADDTEASAQILLDFLRWFKPEGSA